VAGNSSSVSVASVSITTISVSVSFSFTLLSAKSPDSWSNIGRATTVMGSYTTSVSSISVSFGGSLSTESLWASGNE